MLVFWLGVPFKLRNRTIVDVTCCYGILVLGPTILVSHRKGGFVVGLANKR